MVLKHLLLPGKYIIMLFSYVFAGSTPFVLDLDSD